MKKYIYLVVLISVVWIFAACSNYTYYGVGNSTVNISKYRTFAWLPPIDKAKTIDDITDEKITTEATDQLEKRGLVLKSSRPDALVRYTVMIDDKVRTFNDPQYVYTRGGYYPRLGYYRGNRYMYYSYRQPFPVYVGEDVEQVPYKQGTLIIDLIDGKTKKVIWRGYGVGEVSNPETAYKDIPKVVEGIIKKLPLNAISK
jgi:hypothetical protein